MIRLNLALLVVLLASGCTTRMGDFTILSTKNITITGEAEYRLGTTRIKGIDQTHIVFLFPIGSPSMEIAADRALHKVVGLVDVFVTTRTWYIPFIYGRSNIVVEATPLLWK